jgi:hypothetical protein
LEPWLEAILEWAAASDLFVIPTNLVEGNVAVLVEIAEEPFIVALLQGVLFELLGIAKEGFLVALVLARPTDKAMEILSIKRFATLF